MIALAALALAAGAPASTLRPVFDEPYQLTIEEERSIAGHLYHFGAVRRLVFHRDGSDVIAEVTLLGVTQDIGGTAGKRFETALGVLRDRTMRFHLRDDGTLIAIDYEAALSAVMAGMLRVAATRNNGATIDLPPNLARDEITSSLMPVIAGADAARVPTTHAVSVPPIGAGLAPLSETESVALGTDALLHITVHASTTERDRAVSLDRERSVDRASGLVVCEDETQTIRIGTGVQVTRKRTSLTPTV